MTKTQVSSQVSPQMSHAAKKTAKLLLSLQKPQTPPKFPKRISDSEAKAFLTLHRRFNVKDDNDGRYYQIQILCRFSIGKKKMALVHFEGYPSIFDQIMPISSLLNLK